MAVASSAILSAILCNRCTFKSIFNMLIEFLDPQNLQVDTKIMILARILKKISGISCFGGHFVRHFVYM